MKKFLKNLFIGTETSFFILSMLNIIRFIVFHYFYNVPQAIELAENISTNSTDVYSLSATFFYLGYKENSITIQLYILLSAFIIGIIYSVIKQIVSNKKEKVN